jgi:uncharacterized protein (DUF849 family)
MAAMKDALAGFQWSVSDMDSGQPHRTITQGMLLGGSVRVGLEDSIFLDAIDAGDADAADRAMRHHLTEVLRSLPKVLADRADLFE